ncbi:dash complex subunit [Grosmannia clavigera kw1407]|uniref:DASH complex subunit DAD2 n=1 Tax=Grosmannia clavigera (strain kw1407 / UAMH 11150) TaxID=655863 RepID=F0XTJ9_GROCL|nr:dash complex subunit [Grosmannia clavigera kw1407]EFW98799.1 dash complex subunit [Grosmannia clavigera kw1407]
MAFNPRAMSSGHYRQASASDNLNAAGMSASVSLQTRVNEKKEELENLKQLRDLSAAVASQMEALENKLSTLSDGTEAIAVVMANWNNVLRAINMATTKLPRATESEDTIALPQMLVRIPTEHAPSLQAQAAEAGIISDEQEGA